MSSLPCPLLTTGYIWIHRILLYSPGFTDFSGVYYFSEQVRELKDKLVKDLIQGYSSSKCHSQAGNLSNLKRGSRFLTTEGWRTQKLPEEKAVWQVQWFSKHALKSGKGPKKGRRLLAASCFPPFSCNTLWLWSLILHTGLPWAVLFGV